MASGRPRARFAIEEPTLASHRHAGGGGDPNSHLVVRSRELQNGSSHPDLGARHLHRRNLPFEESTTLLNSTSTETIPANLPQNATKPPR
jgi:hypothetical protein